MNKQLTGWFPGHIKPVRAGVYERRFGHLIRYARWDGRRWMRSSSSIVFAATEWFGSPMQRALDWRGLALPPKERT